LPPHYIQPRVTKRGDANDEDSHEDLHPKVIKPQTGWTMAVHSR
jgi:hypothetical protein